MKEETNIMQKPTTETDILIEIIKGKIEQHVKPATAEKHDEIWDMLGFRRIWGDDDEEEGIPKMARIEEAVEALGWKKDEHFCDELLAFYVELVEEEEI